jgi:calcineurin-like phosphoesterase family protein
MGQIFYISDTHWGHRNILDYAARPFVDLDDMDASMIARWNNVVSDSDLVIHLGDFCFNGKSNYVSDLLVQLKGVKILVRGNHDQLTVKKYREAGFTEVVRSLEMRSIQPDLNIGMTHIPNADYAKQFDLYLHGHVHNKPWTGRTKNSFNVSVENIDYTPITLAQILEKMRSSSKCQQS